MARKSNIIEMAMRKHYLITFFVIIIIILGILSLPKLKKNEFPTVTIRQGVVAVVYPGATSEEIEQQVAGRTEDYLFTFADVDKRHTYSYSEDGMLYIFVTLVNTTQNAPLTWSRIREGLTLFRVTNLPQGVIATAVIDDFGNASSLLLAIESPDRSSRELRQYTDQLSARLRTIPEIGNLKVSGEQKEEIAVFIDPARMTQYAISPSMVSAELALHGFRTITGKADNTDESAIIHVSIPYENLYDISEMVVFSDPITNQAIRLRDIARIERRYAESTSFVEYNDSTVRDNRCIILSLEMRNGNNVVAFGNKVDEQINAFKATLPPDVRIHRITDQPKMVDKSVRSFMKDLVEAVLVVILVMLFLFPLRTALVSSTSVPVCIAATFAIMYFLGIELNTVTLAALVVVLGMIVDDSVVVIDGYSDMLHEGHSRWYCAAVSTKQLMSSMLIATISISGMFFPMLKLMGGTTLGDFISLFPWAIFIPLACSYLYAIWVIPYLSSRMIRRTASKRQSLLERAQNGFFGALQKSYQKMLDACFRHKWTTVIVAFLLVLVGVFLMTRLNVQMLPKAERDSFAVEIHLAAGSSLDETAAVSDSLCSMLMKDPRVVSITSFQGMASPRFHITYAPQLAGNNYAQFIVNTTSDEATKQLMLDWPKRYENWFPEAQIRFKQMDYQPTKSPIEFYIFGDDYAKMEQVADTLRNYMKQQPGLFFVNSDYQESQEVVEVVLDTDEANHLGITQTGLSIYLSGALSGSKLASVWEGSYNVPITVYTDGVHNIDFESLGDLLIPCAEPGQWVPLRQIAKLEPRFHRSCIPHRNGRRCITVSADVMNGYGQMREYHRIADRLEEMQLPEGVTWEPGGTQEQTLTLIPALVWSVVGAILVMFLVLIIHYGEIGISLLAIVQSIICVFGACFGLWMFGLDFSITAILGLVSLIGIIVRNAIIMYDYAGELRKQGMSAHEAAYQAGLRRMRPIFLTSATTALGVIPMIIAHTTLWMPMGVVICFGTILTLPLTIVLLPVTYCLVFDREERRKQDIRNMEARTERRLQRRERRIEELNNKMLERNPERASWFSEMENEDENK